MPDPPFIPTPSARCREGGHFELTAAITLCSDGPGWDAFPNFRTRPDLADWQVPGGRDYSKHGTTPGFNAGMALLPYVVDWGDYLGRITRRRMHASILKAWPRAPDRLTALVNTPRYVDKFDTCIPPITGALIAAEPFAGWKWDPWALRTWLDLVEIDPGCQKNNAAPTADAAVAAAVAWLTRAEKQWSRFTGETFPYTIRDVYDVWKPADALPALP